MPTVIFKKEECEIPAQDKVVLAKPYPEQEFHILLF